MPHIDDAETLARLLPGRWTIKATNFPMWLSGETARPDVRVRAGARPAADLQRRASAYVDADGKQKSIRGTDHWNGRGFTWKHARHRRAVREARWEVAGARQGLAVIRFDKSIATPSGVDVVVAEGVDASELRSTIAADPASFGLTLEEFASLTWLEHTPPA